MELLIAVAIAIGLLCWAFRAGKREGSTKGFGAGRRHERRQAVRRRRKRRPHSKSR